MQLGRIRAHPNICRHWLSGGDILKKSTSAYAGHERAVEAVSSKACISEEESQPGVYIHNSRKSLLASADLDSRYL